MHNTSIRYLKGVGPRKEVIFNNLGVYTVKDLLYYFPCRYEDRTKFKKINQLCEGEVCLVQAKVTAKNLKRIPYFVRARKVRSIFECILADDTGQVSGVWFNQDYLDAALAVGDQIIIYGKPSYKKRGFSFIAPEYEAAGTQVSLNMNRIIGVYRLGSRLKQKFMRKIIHASLLNFRTNFPDSLPFYIRKERNIANIAKSLEEIHFPRAWSGAESARERFIFEELFYSQILVYLRKARHSLQKGIPFTARGEVLTKLRKNLPFTLTPAQEAVLNQLITDLQRSFPMHRLLQGDVGCGKTVVAALVIGVCADCRGQAAFMVPTEVLVYQHKETLDKIFAGFNFNVETVTSSLPKAKIKQIYADLSEGKIDVVIGTHALIQEEVKFKKLSLVVIDEQHKFGVAQRALLPQKAGTNPHCLVMSATPIPRSLALSLYGDLDFSVIGALPSGRGAVENIWVEEQQRGKIYEFLKEKLEEGRQGYIVYPVIEENEDEDLKSLEIMYKEVTQKFRPFSVGMFHGKMKSVQKLEVIKKFRDNKINILVSTTVVEVGVDIKNATVMMVENPERFGLAQLHQLRGRIQRSGHTAYFILISGRISPAAAQRLEVITNSTDGFKIAEEDLKLRGPGDFFGSLQHGFPDLKIADPLADLNILKQARYFAYNVIKRDPYLDKPQHRCIREHLDFWFQK